MSKTELLLTDSKESSMLASLGQPKLKDLKQQGEARGLSSRHEAYHLIHPLVRFYLSGSRGFWLHIWSWVHPFAESYYEEHRVSCPPNHAHLFIEIIVWLIIDTLKPTMTTELSKKKSSSSYVLAVWSHTWNPTHGV